MGLRPTLKASKPVRNLLGKCFRLASASVCCRLSSPPLPPATHSQRLTRLDTLLKVLLYSREEREWRLYNPCLGEGPVDKTTIPASH